MYVRDPITYCFTKEHGVPDKEIRKIQYEYHTRQHDPQLRREKIFHVRKKRNDCTTNDKSKYLL